MEQLAQVSFRAFIWLTALHHKSILDEPRNASTSLTAEREQHLFPLAKHHHPSSEKHHWQLSSVVTHKQMGARVLCAAAVAPAHITSVRATVLARAGDNLVEGEQCVSFICYF